MTIDLSSTDAGRVNDNLPAARDFSMLLPFIYDTSSFPDRQVQIANVDTTIASTPAEGHAPPLSHPSTDSTDHTKGEKSGKPVDK
ncbi:hypothetical protein NW754_000039 [Fusarium falciforme]|uniref:Uncharacterized protein n=1 Tax=Fusarium falciforme TaxID=195108 RepID=A0A9W8R6C2_9HYPO|nr:hypothetical protein NW754_000039 [Fusarium falciforme]KAJ4189268.1 hypothetical protein NW755_006086 [Fusarium falciforme]KAJ4252578.1 hypothetical protein NW757_006020 [Fusarium falciforme]